ncbi:MAG: S-layer homology domain-containing protein [Monoglobaceae bacterium]
MKQTLKRITMFVMALLLMAMTFPAAAKQDSSVYKSRLPQELFPIASAEPGSKAASLRALGIMPDYDTSEYLSRGEMAYAVGRMIADVENSFQEPAFSDVNITHPAYAQICFLKQIGIVSGYDDGSFEPDMPATPEQLQRVLVNVLGYAQIANQEGGFAAVAAKLGLNISTSDSERMTKEEAAAMISRALDNHPLNEQYTDSDERLYEKSNRTLREHYLSRTSIRRGTGVMTGNRYTNFAGESYVRDAVEIDGTAYRCDMNFDDYLGWRVEYYLSSDDKVIGMATLNGNKTLDIDASDISAVNSNAVSWTDENKKRSVRLADNLALIYNGKVLSSYDVKLLKPVCGFLRLLDRDNDGNYDAAFVYTYDSYLVESVSDDGLNITFKQLSTNRGINGFYFTPSDEVVNVLYDANGQAIQPTEIKPGNVLTVFMSKDRKLNRIYAVDELHQGAADRITSDYYEIDGVRYEAAYTSAGQVVPDVLLGINISFNLDLFGNIFYAEKTSISGEFAYIIDVCSDGVFGTDVKVKTARANVLTATQNQEYAWVYERMVSNAGVEVYDCAEKVRVYFGGDEYQESAGRYSGKDLLRMFNENKHGMIRFDCNAEGRICEVRFLGEPDFTIDNGYYKYTTQSIRAMSLQSIPGFNRAIKLENAKCLAIPADKTVSYNDEDYMGQYRLKDATALSGKVNVYGYHDETQTADLLAFEYANFSQMGYLSSLVSNISGIVSAVSQNLDENGLTDHIKFYQKGTLYDLVCDSSCTVSGGRSSISQLRPGDIITVETGAQQRIMSVNVMETVQGLEKHGLSEKKVCGVLEKVETNRVWEGNNDEWYNMFYINVNGKTVAVPHLASRVIYRYSSRGNIETISLQELAVMETVGADPCNLYCVTDGMNLQASIIVLVD